MILYYSHCDIKELCGDYMVIMFHREQDIMMSRFTFLLVKKQKEIQIFVKNSFRISTTVVLWKPDSYPPTKTT